MVKGKMGGSPSIPNTYRYYYSAPDTTPEQSTEPQFSHEYGFPAERKHRSTYLTSSLSLQTMFQTSHLFYDRCYYPSLGADM